MNDPLRQRLGVSKAQLAAFCQRWKITERAVFGSALRDDFRPDSDVDLLVQFAQEAGNVDAFKSNELVPSAVLHQLTILGEAVKRLSDAFRETHDHIPWTDAARMRDRLIHAYDAIDLDIVWQAAPRETPAVLDQITPLAPELPA